MSTVVSSKERKATFRHGIHPAEMKELTADAPIEVLPTPQEVRIPLLQHLGAPCKVVVKPKTEVQPGDLLGEAGGFVSAPVHASVAGVVGRESVATLPNGRHVPVIPIKVSEKQPSTGREIYDAIFGGDWPCHAHEQVDAEQIVAAAHDAGLVGLGGAAFPTHVKLRRNEQKPIDTLLINGCECEPYLTADYRIMLEAPAAVVSGALLSQRALAAPQAIICVEDNKPRVIDLLRRAAEGTTVEIRVLRTKYPQGGEKQLIHATLRREVPTGGLPLDVGVVVQNVGTSAALARAVFRGTPLTHRVVTVSGAGVAHPKNILAPIGASYRDLVEFCGGESDDAARFVAGGPMMGFSLGSLDVPITKGTSGILVLSEGEVRQSGQTACVRCGRCVEACPMRLVPTRIALAARLGNADVARAYQAAACMECGCCAYECPASLPLVQLIRLAKVMVRN